MVLIAAGDVAPRAQVGAVKKVTLPAAGVPEDAVTDESALSEKVSRGFIPGGTVLREAMLQPRWAAGAAGALAEIGREYRLVALPVTLETSVGGCAATGDRVDLYALGKEGEAELVVSDVLVFSGPGVPSQPPGKGLGSLGSQEQKSQDAVVLALRAAEVEKVLDSLAKGERLVAVLRPLEGGER